MKLGIRKLINNKDDIEFVTEFPCLLGHPVWLWLLILPKKINKNDENKKCRISAALRVKQRKCGSYKKKIFKNIQE